MDVGFKFIENFQNKQPECIKSSHFLTNEINGPDRKCALYSFDILWFKCLFEAGGNFFWYVRQLETLFFCIHGLDSLHLQQIQTFQLN